MSGFKKATKEQKKIVMSIQGASGAGKTYSALNIAKYLCPEGKRIAFIDTENSASLYANSFDFDVDDDFGTFGNLNYHPDVWMKKLTAAAQSGEYGVVIMDSLSHLWKGDNGFLTIVDNLAKAAKARTGKYDSHAAWKDADPIYQKFMNGMRHLPFHTIFCLRAKQAYERVEGQTGKGSLKKIGLEPEFRDGFDYDVDAQMIIDEDHVMVPRKHRLQEYLDGKVFSRPGENLAKTILEWSLDGKPKMEVLPIGSFQKTANDTGPSGSVEPASESTNLFATKLRDAPDEIALKLVGSEIAQAKRDGLLDDMTTRSLNDLYKKRVGELRQKVAS